MNDRSEVTRTRRGHRWAGAGILLVGVLFGIFAVYVVQCMVIVPSFANLERNEAEKDLSRCQDAIANEIHHLDQMCSDWSVWDDTYQFVQDKNEAYLKANVVWKTLEGNSGINLIMFYRPDGEKIWGEAYDTAKGGQVEVEGFQGESLGQGNYLLDVNSPEDKLSGLILTNQGPLLIVSRPVLTSDGNGPVRAVMLMGKFLDEDILHTLADQTKVSFDAKDLGKAFLTPDDERRLALLAHGDYVLEEASDDLLHGYAVLNDLRGKPALQITTSLPRDIMRNGLTTAHIASLSVIVALLTLSLCFWLSSDWLESRRRTARVEKLVEERTAELRESEVRFDQIAEHSRTVIWEVDTDGLYTYVSHASEAVLGLRPEDLVGKRRFCDLHPQAVWEALQEMASHPIKDSSREIECAIQSKDGQVGWVAIDGIRVVGADGALVGYRGSDTDITDRKRAAEEKAKLQDQLVQSQKMESVGRLAGGVAHDFNNMLSVILGNAEIALREAEPTLPLRDNLEEILKAATRSADLTRQLLAFARKQAVTPKSLDLNDTVTGTLKMLQRIIGEDIELAWMPGADVWPVKVDPSQIDQILANLCVNARDAIADVGKVTIETANRVFGQKDCAAYAGLVPGEYAMLAISDNGSGMDKETQSHLFEPFFTTKEIGKGTGLGLATVYGAVKQNNGFINVYSEPGHGTIFRIYLPRHTGGAEKARTQQVTAPAEGGQETILLVEDEPAILKMTTELLETRGYTVLAASTPGEATRLAREYEGEIHLLMTDVVMPDMNGRDLARNLNSLYPRLKRLFMSGYTADVIAHHGVLDEGVHFIQKPFSISDLLAAVRDSLDDRASGGMISWCEGTSDNVETSASRDDS